MVVLPFVRFYSLFVQFVQFFYLYLSLNSTLDSSPQISAVARTMDYLVVVAVVAAVAVDVVVFVVVVVGGGGGSV